MKHPLTRRVLLAALWLSAGAAGARVSWLFGRGVGDAAGVLQPQEPGWSRAYATTLRINRGKARLETWGTAANADQVVADLRRRMSDRGGASWFAVGSDTGWGIACENGLVHRYLFTRGGGNYTLLFQLTQSFEDFRASRMPPTYELAVAPPAPGASPLTYLEDQGTGLSVQASRVSSSPDEVRHFYGGLLSGNGWSPTLGTQSTMDLYVRGEETLIVSALSAGDGLESVVMLAHKRRGDAPTP